MIAWSNRNAGARARHSDVTMRRRAHAAFATQSVETEPVRRATLSTVRSDRVMVGVGASVVVVAAYTRSRREVGGTRPLVVLARADRRR